MNGLLTVGTVAEKCNVKVQTLHYYEKEGLIDAPSRTSSNYRVYSEDAIRQIKFIKNAQKLGFSLDEIKDLLMIKNKKSSSPENDCEFACDWADAKVIAIEEKIKALQKIKKALNKLSKNCSKESIEECLILNYFDTEE